MAQRITTALNGLSDGYNELQAATAIITAITPSGSTNLSASDLAADLSYTESQREIDLSALIANILTALGDGTGITSANDLRDAIYNANNNLVLSKSSHGEWFRGDIDLAQSDYNGYGAVQTNLDDISGTCDSTVKSSIFSALGLSNFDTNGSVLKAAIRHTVAVNYDGSYSAFVTAFNAAVESADVSNINTAAVNLRNAAFSVLLPTDAYHIQMDLQTANDVDDAVTMDSFVGIVNSYCKADSTHKVYSCNGAGGAVVTLIANNDCTSTGFATAMTDCANWAVTLSDTLFLSYDGVNCLGVTLTDVGVAGMYCQAGLNYYLD